MNSSPHDDGAPDIEALLPWYVTGRISAADRQRVERYLERYPERHAALLVAKEEAAANIAANEALLAPDAENLGRLLARLPPSQRNADTETSPTLVERLVQWISDLAPQQAAFAAVALITVVALQAVTIGTLLGSRSGVYETATGSDAHPAASSVELLIGFKPEATMADTAAFLKDNDLAIIDGPNAGIFRVAARGKGASSARLVDKLKTSPLVAVILPGR